MPFVAYLFSNSSASCSARGHFSFHIPNLDHLVQLLIVFCTFLKICCKISWMSMIPHSKCYEIKIYDFIENTFVIFIETVQYVRKICVRLW